MTELKPIRMKIEQFHAWGDARARAGASDEPKWELLDGVPVMQDSERWSHVRSKMRVARAFQDAIMKSGLPLECGLDGLGVRIAEDEMYVPEVVVFPAGRIADHERLAPEPVIVVEVLSPSSRGTDFGKKALGYARVPSICHYLVVDPEPGIVHPHARDGAMLAPGPVRRAGEHLTLDPPGLTIAAADVF